MQTDHALWWRVNLDSRMKAAEEIQALACQRSDAPEADLPQLRTLLQLIGQAANRRVREVDLLELLQLTDRARKRLDRRILQNQLGQRATTTDRLWQGGERGRSRARIAAK